MVNPKDVGARVLNLVHRTLFDATKGRLGGEAWGMKVVKLETTGARSGQRRTTMLTSPLQDGDSLVLIASYGGDSRHPSWYHNLLAHPEVGVTMEGRTRRMVARVAEGEEREQLWERVTADHRNYADYQRRTDRQIPVVVLDP